MPLKHPPHALRAGLLALLVFQAGPSAAATQAGKVVYAFGQVEAVQADGRARALQRGDVFGPGDTVTTHNGRAQLRFTDGGFAALQPNTEYRVEDYHFQGKADGKERSFLNLVRGSVRLVTGIIGRSNKKNFRLRTSVATIGIRGTAGKVSHCDSNCGERGPGTSLAGYGGEWDLSSGSYNGPVKPGQATFCNGASCFDIPGFGQRRDVATTGEDDGDELDETLDDNDESVADGAQEPDFNEGSVAGESGVSCEVGGQCGTDLLVLLDQIGAGAGSGSEGSAQMGDTDAFDNAALVLNNGVPVAGVTVASSGDDPGDLPIGMLIIDAAALRQALLDFSDPAISALGLNILDAVPLGKIQALAADPARVGEGDFGLTSDGRLLKGRWQDGNILEVEANFSGNTVISTLRTLSGKQAEHFIVGADPGPLPTNVVGTYKFTGGTFSTALNGSSMGQGVIGGQLLFDFLLGTGSLSMDVRHAQKLYDVSASLQLDSGRFFREINGVALTPGGAYPVEIDGFFAVRGSKAPLAAGLGYLVKTPQPFVGVAGFGLTSSAVLGFVPAAVGSYVAFAHNYLSISSTLESQAFDFRVGAGNSALLNNGVVSAFTSVTHPGLCQPVCAFNAGGANFIRDATGPGGAKFNAALGISWARFGPGSAIAHADVQAPQGSNHVLAVDVPTALNNIPALLSGKTGTYNVIKGGTRPTVIFETGGTQQGEIIGQLTSANMTIMFNTGDLNATLNGSFPAGGGTGLWTLTGNNVSVCPGGGDCFNRTDGIHSLNMMGSVTSTAISNPGAGTTNCGGPGCAIVGHTHFDIAGINATAVAGSYQASTLTPSTPAFGLSGTYVLEGTVTP